jgi:hypothetical protein
MGQKLANAPACYETCGNKITDTKLISEFEVRANTKGRLIDGKYSRKHLNVITNINKL